MKDQNVYVEHILNSREFIWGARLRQSFPLKLVRRLRFRDRMVRARALGEANPRSKAPQVCLLGIWLEEFPYGMPLEFVERNPKKWQMISQPDSPYGKALLTTQTDTVYVYSRYDNLRLDFRMGPDNGKIMVEANGLNKVIDLYSVKPTTISVYPNQGQIQVVIEDPEALEEQASSAQVPGSPATLKKSAFTAQDLEWLEKQSERPVPLSLNNPEWRGVLASAQGIFDNIYLLPDSLDWDKGIYYTRLFQEARCPSITIQGFPRTYRYLVKAVRKYAPQIPVYVIYHGNFLQMREEYEWSILKMIKELYSNGDIQKIGFAKKGMAEIMTSAGFKSSFIMHTVRAIPEAPSQPLPDKVHVSIWGEPDWSWRKPPYAMMASLRLIPEAVGHVYNVSQRAHEFGDLLSIQADYVTKKVPQAEVMQVLAKMHLNLYVTLSECAPMLPLQSLSVGAPCLFGPTTYFFEDEAYLHSRLVVPYPDHADVIAEKANLVLAERSKVIDAYRAYAPGYNQRVKRTLENFLEFSFD